jgi:O-antigen/teichoic acid export membrane protein
MVVRSLTALTAPSNGPTEPGDTRASIAIRLRSGVSWSLAGAVANSATNLLLNVLLARVLGKEGFGEFAIVQSTMITVSGVAQLATGFTANKYLAEFHTVDKARTSRIVGFCFIVSIVTAVLGFACTLASAGWIAVHGLDKPQLVSSLRVASGAIFFSVLNGFQLGALAGLESFRRFAKGLALGAVGNAVACLVGARIGGAHGASMFLTVGACLQWLALRQALLDELKEQGVRPVYKGLAAEKRIFVHFALPAAISGFVVAPAVWLANSFLIRGANGVEQMALFAAANSFRSLVLFLPQLVNRVTTTLLNTHRGESDVVRYREVFKINFLMTAGAALLGAGGVAILGPWLLRAFGKSFHGAYPALLFLLLAAVFEVLFQAVYLLVQSNEKMWHSFALVLVPRDSFIVIFAFLLAPRFGVVGLAAAYGTGWLLAFLLVSVLAMRIRLLPRVAPA